MSNPAERVRVASSGASRGCLLKELEFQRAVAFSRSQRPRVAPGARNAYAERADALAELIAYGKRAWGFAEAA